MSLIYLACCASTTTGDIYIYIYIYIHIHIHEFEQTLGEGGGQGSLACCSPWGLKELDVTKQ